MKMQQKIIDYYVTIYNEIIPHENLNLMTLLEKITKALIDGHAICIDKVEPHRLKSVVPSIASSDAVPAGRQETLRSSEGAKWGK